MLTVIELVLPVSYSSTRISKLYVPIDSEHKFHKTGIRSAMLLSLSNVSFLNLSNSSIEEIQGSKNKQEYKNT